MYNSETKSYTLEDVTGSYDWMWENVDNLADFTDEDIANAVDTHIEFSKQQDIDDVTERAEEQEYPRYGYTTADVYEDAEEWLADKLKEIENDYMTDRAYAIAAFKIARDSE